MGGVEAKKGEGCYRKCTTYREKTGCLLSKEFRIRISPFLKRDLKVYIIILETK